MDRLLQIWTEVIVARQLEVREVTVDHRQMFDEIQEEILIQFEAQMENWNQLEDDCTEVGDMSTERMG